MNLESCKLRGEGRCRRIMNRAAKWFQVAAQQGDAQAENKIGYLYDVGREVAKDYAQAVSWYRKSG